MPEYTIYADGQTTEYQDPNSNKTYTLERRFSPALGTYGDTTKEVTLGFWNGEYRLDIRKWENGKLGKGISLTEDEVRILRDHLDKILFGR